MKRTAKAVNVNLGCGANIIKDWINIDDYDVPADTKYFLKADVRALPLESNSVDYILCDQVLEHIAMSDIPTVLYEIKRVLKKGGRCVICVPDFRGSVEQWLKVDHDQFFNPFLFKYLSEVLYGSQEHEGQYHRTPMTAGFLHYSLKMVGLAKHDLIMHIAFGPIPQYPGMTPPVSPEARLRNPQLIADIIKV